MDNAVQKDETGMLMETDERVAPAGATMSPDLPGENTYVLDPNSPAELARLTHLDRFTTKAMGGPLSGLPSITPLRQILDVACGPGGWVLDVAFERPDCEIAGVDSSLPMIKYAYARAQTQKLANASFEMMDITQPLSFPDGVFDLVNARFLCGVLRREAWPAFLVECLRILRPGGILRLTDMIDPGVSTSPAYAQLNAWLIAALSRAGYGFSVDERSLCLTAALPHLMRKAGYQHLTYQAYALEFSSQTEAWNDIYRSVEVIFYLIRPLLLRTEVASSEEIEHMYQRALIEMLSDDFLGMWHFLSCWGVKPEDA